MAELFLKVVSMSVSAGWLVLAVLVFRLVFRRAPKWLHVLLWGLVAVRLLCPFSVESAVSLLPEGLGDGGLVEEWTDSYVGDVWMIHDDSPYYDAAVANGREPVPAGEGRYYVVAANDRLGAPPTVRNTVVPVLAAVWAAGIAALLAYTVISCFRLRRRVQTAVLLEENVFQCETVDSPFVMGVLRPRIYLPFGVAPQELEYVLAHERAHIQRRDHWWKPLGFLLLTIHWFDPLMWVAYILLCRDIELACDEKVIQELGNRQRADYSQALLSCSVPRRFISACPLAFGEAGVKERVKSILRYRKPAFWVVAVSVIACAAVAVCFLTNPKQDPEELPGLEDDPVPPVEADGSAGGSVTVSDSSLIAAFSDLDRDGESENIVVRTIDPGMLYELAVEEQDGTKIWTSEAGPAHTGWNTILLYSEDGQDYLVQYRPAMFQGMGSYTCTVFSLEGGRQTVKRELSVDFEVQPGDPVTVEETSEMKQFARAVNLLLRNSTVLLSTEQGILVDRPAGAAALPQLYPVRFDPDEIQAAVDGREEPRTLTPNAARFPEEPLELLFASGAGAWGTFLTLNPDGSFTGSYSDAEMGDNGAEYPHGTYYVCEFEGRFTDIRQISDNAFSLRLESVTTEKPEGETWIEDQLRYVASGPHGISGGEDFLLCAPGTPADELPADCRDWWPDAWLWRSGEAEALDGWALCSVDEGLGFYERKTVPETPAAN